ncbi:MAG: hypothetical protein C5B48_01600 [Candidatus Rokuibacteriota bacterium]|nr:MAG: hypothetical protein C5B48_01600 [Candidatus Rokubacteria bacterium]
MRRRASTSSPSRRRLRRARPRALRSVARPPRAAPRGAQPIPPTQLERNCRRLAAVGDERLDRVRSLLQAPSPAVLATYRKDGSAHVSPVWFRWEGGAIEVVIAERDVKLRHLERDPRCVLVVFEAVRPFRGLEVRGKAQLVQCEVTPIRAAIAGRYLGPAGGERFAAARRPTPAVLLRLALAEPRVWDLEAILPG